MGKFAEEAKIVAAKVESCPAGLLLAEVIEDDADLARLTQMAKNRQWEAICVGSDGTRTQARSFKQHLQGLCRCGPDAIGRGVVA